MAFNLMFWKKKEDDDLSSLGLGPEAGLGGKDDLGLGLDGSPTEKAYPHAPETPEVPSAYPSSNLGPSMPQSAGPPIRNDILSKDIEIISSKLDAIRAGIESINQRLANLEAHTRRQYEKVW